MSEPLIKTKDISRHYKRGEHTVKALDSVSIEIKQGEFLSLVGSSGSGKSTLLNLLAGLDTATSGEIYIESTKFSDLKRRERSAYRAKKVGMVFQSFNLISHYDALENVAMALLFDHTPRVERKQIAKEILTEVGLGERLDHLPSDLSGGEQQRVAIARALVKKPQILFADEPTGNLDLENTKQIASMLQKLNQSGLTIVMVTHDLELAKNISGRVIKMDYGKIVGES